MLDEGNPGLKHIRSLVLRDNDEHPSVNRAVIAYYPNAADLVYRLPKNVLINFHDVPIDAFVRHEPYSLQNDVDNIERLRIMPGPSEPLPQIARQLLQKCQTLRQLSLEFDYMAQDDSTVEDTNGRYTSSGALQALFTGLDSSTIRLRSLDLTGVNLGGTHHNPLLAAINTFLAKISGLRNLWICLRGFDQLPEVAQVAKHGSTLRWLFIDIMTHKMPTLRKLGINNWPTPPEDYLQDPPDDYVQEEDSSAEGLTEFDFMAYEDNLALLVTELVQLRQEYSECGDLTIIRFGLLETITDETL
ncbi:MAG: hypothetical protein Q9221_002622 [Calogaya cf. arnoldii]